MEVPANSPCSATNAKQTDLSCCVRTGEERAGNTHSRNKMNGADGRRALFLLFLPAACHKYLTTVGAGRAPTAPCRSRREQSPAESAPSGKLLCSTPHLDDEGMKGWTM